MRHLVDIFGRQQNYLRVSVTDRCNLRCFYCMPPNGVEQRERKEMLTFEEIARVCALFARLGVTKIRLTGGEPLIRRNLPALVSRLASIPDLRTIGLTTNGTRLSGHLHALKDAGLRSLNISLDTLRRDRFESITAREGFHDVLRGIDDALYAGFEDVKINVVVMRGVNDDELTDFVAFALERALAVRFIEFMPFKQNRWGTGGFVSFEEMKRRIDERFTLVPSSPIGPSVIAKMFTVRGHRGKVGFITSMSDDFCSGCNRLRLLADGSLKSCLFSAPGVCLRDALRSRADDDALESLIRTAVRKKTERHPSAGELVAREDHSMIEIGG